MTNASPSSNIKYAPNSISAQDADFLTQMAQAQKDVFSGANTGEQINGTNISDFITGNGGNDTIIGKEGDDELFGESGDDKIYGESGDDKIYGSAGNDEIEGGFGNDLLEGGVGDDKINGNANSDRLIGNAGNDDMHDTITLGQDTFYVDGGETRDDNGYEHQDTLYLNTQRAGNTVFTAVKNGTEYNLIARGGNYNNQIVGQFSGIEVLLVNGERVAIPQ